MMIIYVRKDIKDMLPTDMREYEAKIGYMTRSEKRELREWVANGNKVICNPWCIAGEDGRHLDFITASRTIEDMLLNPEDYGIGCETEPYKHDEVDELPF